MICKFVFFIAFISSILCASFANNIKEKFPSDFQKFKFNSEGRLEKATVIIPQDPPSHCIDQYKILEYELQTTVSVSNEFLENIYQNAYQIFPKNDVSNGCPVVCLPYFQHQDFINTPLDFQIGKSVNNVENFIVENCSRVEVSMMNYLKDDVILYWIHPDTNERIYINTIYVDSHHYMQSTYIGHVFVFVNKITNEDVKTFTVTGYGYIAVGDFVTEPIPDDLDVEGTIKGLFKDELYRSNLVKRTFSELGFKKGKLPRDIWGSMTAYYHANRDHATIEPWKISSGLHVNWYEADCFMVWIPTSIKDIWAERLLKLVEEWVGIPLEPTSLYGMRKYTSGARLLTHVDRTETHAASLIVNIAQSISSPWPVQIYDFKQRLHEIEMEEGDIVYYESAKCLHGRMTPLPHPNGYYVNLFTHYRPIGDNKWYLKNKDPHNPDPWLEFEEGKEPSTLSPLKQTLVHDDDLFNYWKSIELVLPPYHTHHRQRLYGNDHSEL